MSIVYINGDYLPIEEAKISVMDRGFLFGDGLYEVMPVFNDRIFCFDEHLARMQQNIRQLSLPTHLSQTDWRGVLGELILKNPGDAKIIYIQITRGAALNRQHHFPEPDTPPTVFAKVSPLTLLPLTQLKQGFTAITVNDVRWQYRHIKSTSLLGNVLMQQQAIDQNAYEAIAVENGYALEGASSNLFIVRNQQLITPPLTNALLPGITRQLILKLAKQNDIEIIERPIPLGDLMAADEVWLCASGKEIRPIVTIDGHAINQGKTGPIFERMYRAYQAEKRKTLDQS